MNGVNHPQLPYKIVAVDFDNTLAQSVNFPEIGKPNMEVINRLKEHMASGGKWILWTCRNGIDLRKAVEWCEVQGLVPDAINEDVPDVKNTQFGRTKSIKPYYNECWDDKSKEVTPIGTDKETEPIGIDQNNRLVGVMSLTYR